MNMLNVEMNFIIDCWLSNAVLWAFHISWYCKFNSKKKNWKLYRRYLISSGPWHTMQRWSWILMKVFACDRHTKAICSKWMNEYYAIQLYILLSVFTHWFVTWLIWYLYHNRYLLLFQLRINQSRLVLMKCRIYTLVSYMVDFWIRIL